MGIPQGLPLDDLEASVASRFEAAIGRLGRAGARLFEMEFSVFDDMARVQSPATIATVEAYRIHRELIAARGRDYDPIVRSRIETGGAVSAAEYAQMLRSEESSERDGLELAERGRAGFAHHPHCRADHGGSLERQGFNAANRLLLRNAAIANFFDLCAISLPMPGTGALPAGLMLFARRGRDRQLFAIAAG